MTTSIIPEWIPRRLLSVKEVAELLNVSQRNVYRLIQEGQLRATRIGRRVLVRPESIVAFLQDG